MDAGANATERLAEWAAELQYDGLPRRVIEECKTQILSVIASVHAGHFTDAGRTVTRTVKEWPGGKEATMMPSGERTAIDHALFANCALGMALDYDDYLFAGHTGHSAVLATLALAEKHNVTGKDFLVAQTVANEIEGRLGAAAILGPLNGQLWSFLHLAGGALVGARVLGLDKKQTASALGLALAQPNNALWGGFFGSDAKILLASQTVPAGIRAADLAANGLRGPTDIIEHAQGVLKLFTPEPLFGALAGLGSTWLTETLSYKLYPGCAYIDTVVDCVLHLAHSHSIDPKKVRAIHVAANPLTAGMEALSAPHVKAADTPVMTLNFTVGYNAAVALMDKELTPRQFLRERIKDRAAWELAGKVQVTLDDDLARRLRQSSLLKSVATPQGERFDLDLSKADTNAYRAAFGSRVRIEMEDGRTFEAEEEIPRGGAGRPLDEKRQAVEDKFRRETRYTLRKEKMERAIDLVEHLDQAAAPQVREIVKLCCSERS